MAANRTGAQVINNGFSAGRTIICLQFRVDLCACKVNPYELRVRLGFAHSSMLLVLSDDLLRAVLLLLDDIKSILACQATCRRFKTVVKNSLQIQYKIELGTSGMCEGPDARHLNAFEKLQRLRAYQAARAGDITFEELPFVPALFGDIWLMRSSVTTLVLMSPENDGLRIDVQQMPSVMRGIEERHWSIKLADIFTVAGFDASQDLLMVQKVDRGGNHACTLSILSLSTGERHPSAVFDSTREVHDSGHVEVFRDHCAVACSEQRRSCLAIWNWKTGSTKVNLFPPQSGLVSGFTFLDGGHIAIMSRDSPAILVYSFDLAQSDYLPTTFLLPPDIDVTPPTLIPCTAVAGAEHAGIFHPAPSARILSLFLTSSEVDGGHFLLNILADTLLAHLQDAPATVPWADWGPAGSRLTRWPRLTQPPDRSEMCVVTLAPDGRVGPDGSPVGVLADYRPSRVAQARQRGLVGLVEKATSVADEDLGGLTEAALPYAIRQFTMPWNGERVDRLHKVIACEDQMFVFEQSYAEDRHLVVKAWAGTI
ncbi:hypothetical protein FA95DRAFT_713390 [Auriscalpium vulgare]|uniref:Uncharacterized protein n=1 Tax=Auriscalpium vulgare TaxID=40419 RepID=A0ACB8RCE4_9AGAM|nr:hypothetical protein FA95DRAFT_713390 [Auriscalpium vulgare]